MRLSESFLKSLLIVSPVWLFSVLQWVLGQNWARLGIFPRSFLGAVGILTAPLVHGDLFHLLSNTLPLLILCTAMFMFYPRESRHVLITAYWGTGLSVWLLGRPSYHIGISGQVYALASFLFFSGLFRRNRAALTIALCTGLLYGGMLQGIFPQADAQNVSWESHLLGATVGAWLAWHYRNMAAPLPRILLEHNELLLWSDLEEGYRPLRNKKMRYVFKPRIKNNKVS
ncbi:MAG: rhomboid family intramembrane serine protease [Cytophagales bacterium]|nr:rhomboid family intramembrane serine protease [Bernardetiaceae bacterium]MDW8205838.1 rhomboid family intramembrane serine protease [Cytophagales bacterium]